MSRGRRNTRLDQRRVREQSGRGCGQAGKVVVAAVLLVAPAFRGHIGVVPDLYRSVGRVMVVLARRHRR